MNDLLPGFDKLNIISSGLDQIIESCKLLIIEKSIANGHKMHYLTFASTAFDFDRRIIFCLRCPFEILLYTENGELEYRGDDMKDICPRS